MAIPYQRLTEEEKKQKFYGDPVNHSGILPSGEGNYYDPNQTIRNDGIFDTNAPKAVIRGGTSSHPVDPTGVPPSPQQPNNLAFTNNISTVDNPEAAGPLGQGNNAYSNATKFPPNVFYQGPYIHFYKQAQLGLLPDSDGVSSYYPTSRITPTVNAWYPYGSYPQQNQSQFFQPQPSGIQEIG